jgi:hypothetical protein
MSTEEDIAHQQNLLDIYRRNLSHYLRQQAALGEAYAPPAVTNGILEARTNIKRIKQILRGWNVSVQDHPDDGDVTTSPPTSSQVGAGGKVDRVKFRQFLTDYFNDDELRELCFDMGIDYENLAGVGKASKARELITYAERHGSFEELVKTARQLRPNIAW